MQSQNVYAIQCPDYDQVPDKIEALLAMMGGIKQFVHADEQIVLKPNLLIAVKPEKAVTTHPSVVAAVGRLAKQAGAKLCILDSPGSGYPHSEKTLNRVYRVTGMYAAAEQAGIETCLNTAYQAVSFPEGQLIKRMEVLTPIVEADGVINLCKLKTHGFLSMTGAVKNSFGIIPGLTKPGYHANLQKPGPFASMCLDLVNFMAPRLSIMDAVVGMEGNGPQNGTPRHAGWLLASTNPLALDCVAAEIMGLQRERNYVLLEAEKRAMTPNRIEQVELIGARIEELRIPGYKLPATTLSGLGSTLMTVFGPLFRNAFSVRPRILVEKCVACGFCRDACPVHVISIVEEHAEIKDRQCIRCYCCHEMCPHDAIELKQGALYRLFN